MLREAGTRTLVKARDVKAVSDSLMKGDYAPSIEKVVGGRLDAATLTRAFYSVLISRCYSLAKIAPEGAGRFLEAYFERFLVEDLKKVLRAKCRAAAVDGGALVTMSMAHKRLDLKAIAEAPTLQACLDMLDRTRFKGMVRAGSIYQKYGIVSVLEAFLDKAYYDSQVGAAMEEVPDSDLIDEMVGAEADLVNISTIADLRNRGVSTDAVLSLTSVPRRLTGGDVARLAEANPGSIPELVQRTRYSGFAQKIQDAFDSGKDQTLELATRSAVLDQTKSMMVRHADTMAYVMGYVREAEAEANNLVSIATGKELGLSESLIAAAICM